MGIDPIGDIERRLAELERLVALLLHKLESEGVIKGPQEQKRPLDPTKAFS